MTNTRGDVTELRTSGGSVYATYTYDSWGRCVSVIDGNGEVCSSETLAVQNSIRYRGYVYDHETGLYYLQSRYYDPETGRFINADDVEYIGYSGEQLSYNMFAYCENNATNDSDPLGRAPKSTWVGFGIQFEASGSLWGLSGCIGLEFVWFTSSQVKSRKNKVPYAYWYYSRGMSFSNGKNVLDKLIDKICKNPKGIFVDRISVSVSVCVFAIKGYTKSSGKYEKFSHPDDYLGPFNSKGSTINHIKGYKATSTTCVAYGLGGDFSQFAIGTVYSYYRYANGVQKLLDKIAALYNTVKTRAEKAK